MTKWIVGLLLVVNMALFAWMRWGGGLMGEGGNTSVQPALNSDKIRLLDMQPALGPGSAPVSTVSGVALTLSPLPAPSSAPAASMPVAATPLVPAKQVSCAEWGEFSGHDLARAQEALATLQLGDRLSQRSVEHKQGFWVYIPPVKKHAEVEKKIAQLKARGVKDLFVVQERGKWLNAISLGVFRTRDAAQKYLVVVRGKGVDSAKLGERASKLRFTVFVMKRLDGGMADRLVAFQKGFPDSELKVSACGN
jgi:hypothetical protein